MRALHLEILVEEPSMEDFLHVLLPRILPDDCTFLVHSFQGKADLLGNLEARLRAYAKWRPEIYRILVIVDRDADDCHDLKHHLERVSSVAGLTTRSSSAGPDWQVANRIVIEELEAWYFGDWDAVSCAYPRVSRSTVRRRGYRDPDAVRGGTWESFERILNRHGYFRGGLSKRRAAREIGAFLDPSRNVSRSFSNFRDAVLEATDPSVPVIT